MKVNRKIFDAHSHIGTMIPYKYYGLPEPIQPTWFEFEDAKAVIKDMDAFGVERRMLISNYGIPDSTQPLTPGIDDRSAQHPG